MTEAVALPTSTQARAHWPLSLVVGLVLTAAVIATALTALVWTPYDPAAVDIAAKLTAPSAAHWMGTDHFGRDVLSMIMAGAQNSLIVALVAVGVGASVGTPLGLLAAARGGWIDELVMRGNDLIFAFPALLLAVMITAVMGPGAINAIIAIGVFNIPVFTRVARGAAQGLWTREYVLAARTAGKSRALISVQHILPNLTSLLIVQAAIQFAVGIVAEAGLSYVGLGAQPPAPSWGRMLAEAQTMIGFAPWLAVMPGLAIFVTVLGLSLTGDGLRDLFDPRVRRER
ncbi:Glutathione transport system permease protein GsiD [Brevundimonas sp. SH203]|uniref:ABC transporter permease n=1 Tax=Brevundimonas sp. SH203 TaxID=345167 RepID=UPI0009C76960|nr:ABC transporter permease [Brevundimonas sp. SH203]GAW41133.1 Glutathione transport system permease protein GsiD [Brevundimonas sp. SH203]